MGQEHDSQPIRLPFSKELNIFRRWLVELMGAGEAEIGLVGSLRTFFGTLDKSKSPAPWAFLREVFEGAG